MKTILTTITCLLLTISLQAQNSKIVTNGKIEFEKRINMHAATKNLMNNLTGLSATVYTQAYDDFKRTAPQFATLNSTLIFNDNKSLFTPIAPPQPIKDLLGTPLAKQFNTIYTDMASSKTVTLKDVYGDRFLISDSLSKIKWKLTDETQEVAGYTCRRANGLIQDSVYVVAFYTDKIWMSSGPESFSGLPGMILKVALPYENVIWTATKITTEPVSSATITPPAKGTVVNKKQLYDKLKSALSNSTMAPYYLKLYLL